MPEFSRDPGWNSEGHHSSRLSSLMQNQHPNPMADPHALLLASFLLSCASKLLTFLLEQDLHHRIPFSVSTFSRTHWASLQDPLLVYVQFPLCWSFLVSSLAISLHGSSVRTKMTGLQQVKSTCRGRGISTSMPLLLVSSSLPPTRAPFPKPMDLTKGSQPTTTRHHFTHTRVASTERLTIALARMWGNWNSHTGLLGCKMVQSLRKIIWQLLKRLNI